MPLPFPGMDPYLEAKGIWPDFHQRFTSGLSDALNRLLPAPYYAKMDARPDLGIVEADAPPRRRFVADAAIARGAEGPGGLAVLEAPARLLSRRYGLQPDPDAYRHHFIEVRDSETDHKLVTLIEILSPSNKKPGPDRLAYEFKQRSILDTDASLVEIDLLRGGQRVVPSPGVAMLIETIEPPVDAVVLVSVAWRRVPGTLGYLAYPSGLREPLPCIEVPLKDGEAQPLLDLQRVFDRVYDGGPYARGAVDYARSPEPPLVGEDAVWARGMIGPR